MIIKLIKDARVNLSAGTVVNVNPATGNFLISVGSAVAAPEPKKEAPKKGKKK